MTTLLIDSVGIPRGHCTKTSTLGASTILVTETAVITTFITPTVTILATRTFSNTSISTVNEAPTETDTSFSFEITSFTTTIPTITVYGAVSLANTDMLYGRLLC